MSTVAWETSDRSARLPKNWAQIRLRILRRDPVCRWRNVYGDLVCEEPSTDVDHIVPGDDHRPANLQGLCSWHHARKSSGEGRAAQYKHRQKIKRSFRHEDVHPAFL